MSGSPQCGGSSRVAPVAHGGGTGYLHRRSWGSVCPDGRRAVQVPGKTMFYVVDIRVTRQRAEEWEGWMRSKHVPDVIGTGCFLEAWMLLRPEEDTSTHRAYRMMYRLSDEAALERYQSDHAAFLQQEHLELFAGDYEASRSLFPVVESFRPAPAGGAGTP